MRGAARSRAAPRRQEPEDAGQRASVLGQVVGQPGGPARVEGRRHYALALQPAEPVGQDVGSDPGERVAEVAPPPGPFQQSVDQKEAPPIADPGNRVPEGWRGGTSPLSYPRVHSKLLLTSYQIQGEEAEWGS
jgi:hypothetical protein